MMRKNVTPPNGFPKSNAQYHRMTAHNDGFVDTQFEQPPPPIPWKAITLAVLLTIGGSILVVIGSLLVSGHIDSKYGDRTWPLIIMGILMLIPGVYHVRLACLAFKGCAGYSFEDIPEFE